MGCARLESCRCAEWSLAAHRAKSWGTLEPDLENASYRFLDADLSEVVQRQSGVCTLQVKEGSPCAHTTPLVPPLPCLNGHTTGQTTGSVSKCPTWLLLAVRHAMQTWGQ